VSSTSLVVEASGLCTPGPVRLGGVHRLLALFLLQGIRRAAPAQVTAYRVVTVFFVIPNIVNAVWLLDAVIKLPLPLQALLPPLLGLLDVRVLLVPPRTVSGALLSCIPSYCEGSR